MYPPGHKKGGVLQGIPVAIGTERRSMYTEDTDVSTSGGSRSGGSSPRSFGSARSDHDSRPQVYEHPRTIRDSRRTGVSVSSASTARPVRYSHRY